MPRYSEQNHSLTEGTVASPIFRAQSLPSPSGPGASPRPEWGVAACPASAGSARRGLPWFSLGAPSGAARGGGSFGPGAQRVALRDSPLLKPSVAKGGCGRGALFCGAPRPGTASTSALGRGRGQDGCVVVGDGTGGGASGAPPCHVTRLGTTASPRGLWPAPWSELSRFRTPRGGAVWHVHVLPLSAKRNPLAADTVESGGRTPLAQAGVAGCGPRSRGRAHRQCVRSPLAAVEGLESGGP